jgi:tRNA pseudouridine55 synthase
LGRRNKGRQVNGILLLNKPLGVSSNGALQKVRHLFLAVKAGHTGSLDPLATGVLPICFGEATKFTQFLLDADKKYNATIRFGVSTASGDAGSEVVSELGAEDLTAKRVEAVLAEFRGNIAQVPSMYSALKHEGQRLYKLARQGISVDRKARDVIIYSLEMTEFRFGEFPEADIKVHCSKGTYIRSLAEDIGSRLGCGAYVSKLHREAVGQFNEKDSITMGELESISEPRLTASLDRLLKPMDAGIQHLMAIYLSEDVAFYFRQGQTVMTTQAYREGKEGDIVRVFHLEGSFLGVGEVTIDGKLAPKRLVI